MKNDDKKKLFEVVTTIYICRHHNPWCFNHLPINDWLGGRICDLSLLLAFMIFICGLNSGQYIQLKTHIFDELDLERKIAKKSYNTSCGSIHTGLLTNQFWVFITCLMKHLITNIVLPWDLTIRRKWKPFHNSLLWLVTLKDLHVKQYCIDWSTNLFYTC